MDYKEIIIFFSEKMLVSGTIQLIVLFISMIVFFYRTQLQQQNNIETLKKSIDSLSDDLNKKALDFSRELSHQIKLIDRNYSDRITSAESRLVSLEQFRTDFYARGGVQDGNYSTSRRITDSHF